MDLFEAMQKRRSVRAFVKTDIPMADLEKIVDAGRIAPSGANIQPREFIIVTDPDIITELGVVKGFIGDASAVIAVVSDEEKGKFWLEDSCASAENMLLAIAALDYDTCWIEAPLTQKEMEDKAKEILGVPETKRLMILLPVGKAASPGSQASKNPLEETTYYNKYGQKKGKA